MNRTNRCYLSFSRGIGVPGSARGSRAGDDVPVIANFFSLTFNLLTRISGRSFRRGRRNQHASRVRSPERHRRVILFIK
jgi:hypothetical protein